MNIRQLRRGLPLLLVSLCCISVPLEMKTNRNSTAKVVSVSITIVIHQFPSFPVVPFQYRQRPLRLFQLYWRGVKSVTICKRGPIVTFVWLTGSLIPPGGRGYELHNVPPSSPCFSRHRFKQETGKPNSLQVLHRSIEFSPFVHRRSLETRLFACSFCLYIRKWNRSSVAHPQDHGHLFLSFSLTVYLHFLPFEISYPSSY